MEATYAYPYILCTSESFGRELILIKSVCLSVMIIQVVYVLN